MATHTQRHTHLYSGPTCVRLAYTTRTSRRTNTLVGLVCSQSNILSASRRHPDTCHGEHTVTHQNTTRCNSIQRCHLQKISPSQNASPPKRLSGKLTLPWKNSHTHTHSHRRQRLHSSCLSPLTLHLILHSSPSLCFSLSCFPLLSLSRSLPLSLSLPPPTPPRPPPLLCVSGKACLINDTRHRVRSEGWVSDK